MQTAYHNHNEKIRFFRRHIPAFGCKPGCHDCGGPVTASSEETTRLPIKSKQAHTLALAEPSCPHLAKNSCRVYLERPLIYRPFGTTPRLPCPHGRVPDVMIDKRVEQRIFQHFAETRLALE